MEMAELGLGLGSAYRLRALFPICSTLPCVGSPADLALASGRHRYFSCPYASSPQALGDGARAYRLTTELEQSLLRGTKCNLSSAQSPEVRESAPSPHE